MGIATPLLSGLAAAGTAAGLAAAGSAWGFGSPAWITLGAGCVISLGGCIVAAQAQAASRRVALRLATAERTLEQIAAESDVLRNHLHEIGQTMDAKVELRAEALAAELKVVEALLRQVVDRKAMGTAPAAGSDASPVATPSHHAMAALDFVRNAIEDSRIELHLQPIVRLPSRKPAHYEAFSRVRDDQGAIVLPGSFLPSAEASGLITAIDNLLLFRCVNLIRALGPKRPGTRIFVNLSERSLADAGFIEDFIGFIRQHRELADRIVFEVSADDFARFPASTLAQLSRLAQTGFAFSVDNVQTVDIDADALRRLNVQFVKIDARVLLAGEGLIRAEDVKAMLARVGVDLIVTRIETERDVIDVLELGADFGQGYLFGQPRPARMPGADDASRAA